MTLPASSVSCLAGTLSTGFLGLGALHSLVPLQMSALFGLPTETEAFPRAFIYANGGREVMLSIAFFLLGKQGNRDGMKALMYGTVVSIYSVLSVRLHEFSGLGLTRSTGRRAGGFVRGVEIRRAAVWRMAREILAAVPGGCRGRAGGVESVAKGNAGD